ncbi:MAG: hypothetical protein MPK62_00400 [Alphaproteobacteria bacterium]|nr:hypothetical protein [Alphaproteobacteria bacterium]
MQSGTVLAGMVLLVVLASIVFIGNAILGGDYGQGPPCSNLPDYDPVGGHGPWARDCLATTAQTQAVWTVVPAMLGIVAVVVVASAFLLLRRRG